MEFIANIWNNWTIYEKWTLLATALIILIIIPLSVFVFTKNKKLLLLSVISLLISGLALVLSFIILNGIFSVTITFMYKIVPFVLLFINIASIGMMTGYYAQNHKHKDFTPLGMKKEMVHDTLSLTIALALLFTGFTILTPSLILILLLTLGLSLLVIWSNFLILYYIYK